MSIGKALGAWPAAAVIVAAAGSAGSVYLAASTQTCEPSHLEAAPERIRLDRRNVARPLRITPRSPAGKKGCPTAFSVVLDPVSLRSGFRVYPTDIFRNVPPGRTITVQVSYAGRARQARGKAYVQSPTASVAVALVADIP